MKKFYYIYEINEDWREEFKYRATSEHAAIQWIEDHLQMEKYKDSKFKIQPIYKTGILYSKSEIN
jgi:hypothetical protein